MAERLKEISPAFASSVQASLSYWRESTRELDDRAMEGLDRERHNLFRAVQHGLMLPQTWAATAEIALGVVPLVNRRLYRQEWIPVLERLVLSCPAGQQRQRFNLMIQLGRMQRLEQDRDSAMATLQEAEALARELEDQEALARAYYNIGRVHLDARRYPEAEQLSQNALELVEELEAPDQALYAWVLNSLGRVAQVRNEQEQAEDYYSRSLAVWRITGNQTGQVRALMDLASNFRWFGQPDQAIAYYREAERLLAATGDELDKTEVGINLGATYFDKGEMLLAEQTFRTAYSPYLRKSGNLRYRAILTMNLGNVLLKLERLAEAEAFVRQSIDLWGQLDDDLNRANALGALGEILAGRGHDEAAVHFFRQSMALFEKYPSHPRAIRSLKFFEAEKEKVEERTKK